MGEALILLATNFLWGAYHAVQPGHGKTIAAAYIVGARGRPVDAWILGIFVTLSHTSGIVLVGLLASMGLPGLESKRIEVWLKVLTGVLIIAIGLWTLWAQRDLLGQLRSRSRAGSGLDENTAFPDHQHDHQHDHANDHLHDRALDPMHDAVHDHARDPAHPRMDGGLLAQDGVAGHPAHFHWHAETGYHSHGFGVRHRHDFAKVIDQRPSLLVLVGLGIAGGLVPDPLALSLLIRALAEGKVIVGLIGVLAFSVGFAAVLVAVGVVAAAVGKRLLRWLAGPQAARLQVGMSLLIVLVGVFLTINAVSEFLQVEAARMTG